MRVYFNDKSTPDPYKDKSIPIPIKFYRKLY